MDMNRILKIMKGQPDWEWDSLDGQGFYEIMHQYRHAHFKDEKSVEKAFTLVQEYITWFADQRIKWAVANNKV